MHAYLYYLLYYFSLNEFGTKTASRISPAVLIKTGIASIRTSDDASGQRVLHVNTTIHSGQYESLNMTNSWIGGVSDEYRCRSQNQDRLIFVCDAYRIVSHDLIRQKNPHKNVTRFSCRIRWSILSYISLSQGKKKSS